VNKHLYLCHPLVLSSPTLMMHGYMNLKILPKFAGGGGGGGIAQKKPIGFEIFIFASVRA